MEINDDVILDYNITNGEQLFLYIHKKKKLSFPCRHVPLTTAYGLWPRAGLVIYVKILYVLSALIPILKVSDGLLDYVSNVDLRCSRERS